MDRMESMYSIKAINHTAAEEIQFILEQNHIKCHVDGLEVKTNEEIKDEAIVAEIFPWKMSGIEEC